MHKMDSDTDYSSNSDYDEFSNEITFVSNILQSFEVELSFTAAEIQTQKDLAGTTAIGLMHSQLTRWHLRSKAEIWLHLINSENASICTVKLIKFIILICYCCKNILNMYRVKSVAVKKTFSIVFL